MSEGMTTPKIKLCGLSRPEDIEAANRLKPEYIGFVLWDKSKRKVDRDRAKELKKALDPQIQAVGVFVDESIDRIAELLTEGIIDIAQLHGHEDETYIKELKARTDKPIIKAFQVKDQDDIIKAMDSSADMVLLDSGQGTGNIFRFGARDEGARVGVETQTAKLRETGDMLQWLALCQPLHIRAPVHLICHPCIPVHRKTIVGRVQAVLHIPAEHRFAFMQIVQRSKRLQKQIPKFPAIHFKTQFSSGKDNIILFFSA